MRNVTPLTVESLFDDLFENAEYIIDKLSEDREVASEMDGPARSIDPSVFNDTFILMLNTGSRNITVGNEIGIKHYDKHGKLYGRALYISRAGAYFFLYQYTGDEKPIYLLTWDVLDASGVYGKFIKLRDEHEAETGCVIVSLSYLQEMLKNHCKLFKLDYMAVSGEDAEGKLKGYVSADILCTEDYSRNKVNEIIDEIHKLVDGDMGYNIIPDDEQDDEDDPFNKLIG